MKINQIVDAGSRHGVITEIFKYNNKTLNHIHYIGENGELLICPDKRCRGEHTCPIHGRNSEYPCIISDKDLNFYVKEGLISKNLAKNHKKTLGKSVLYTLNEQKFKSAK